MKLSENGRVQVSSWLDRVLRAKSYRQFEDLHVDDVEARFGAREAWIGGALAVLETAGERIRQLKVPVTPAVGFSLLPSEFPLGLNAASVEQFERELDDSPPSLYLFDRGEEPWHTDADCREWLHSLGVSYEAHLRYFLRQWVDEQDAEYRRSFWMVLE